MKRLLILFLLATPCQAEIISKLSSSTSLSVGGSSTQAVRIPSTYAVSGTNIKVSTGEHIGKLTAGSATAAATLDVGTYEINTAGSAFSLSTSWTQGDAIPAIGSGVDVTSGVVADMPVFGDTTTISGGVAGTLAGTVLSSGIVTVVAGGANTTAVGQVTSELTAR
tara:strand:- start:157 stop:654 length:498 start_codon:yes stop_codon:yes gene_type:complete